MRTKRGRSQIVVSEAALRGLADKLMKLDEWAFDTEIMSDVDFKVYGPNKAFKCVGISISWGSNNTYYIPINHKYTKNQLPEYLISEILHPVFTRKDIRLIGHNMDFDMHVFERLGIKILTDDLWDTQIAGWVIDENQLNSPPHILETACSAKFRVLSKYQTTLLQVYNTQAAGLHRTNLHYTIQ